MLMREVAMQKFCSLCYKSPVQLNSPCKASMVWLINYDSKCQTCGGTLCAVYDTTNSLLQSVQWAVHIFRNWTKDIFKYYETNYHLRWWNLKECHYLYQWNDTKHKHFCMSLLNLTNFGFSTAGILNDPDFQMVQINLAFICFCCTSQNSGYI